MPPEESESIDAVGPVAVAATGPARAQEGTAFAILGGLSFCHLLNDMIASLLPAIYPIFRTVFALDYTEIGLIALTYQCTASIFQPLVGLYTDRRPKPYALPAGMSVTLLGLVLLARASSFGGLVMAAGLVGLGSAVFHPESSRVARMASGGQNGLAQSLFLVGGNVGSSLGPLLAAFIVVPEGQGRIAWFALAALLAIVVLIRISGWCKQKQRAAPPRARGATRVMASPSHRIALGLGALLALTFSKFVYIGGLTNYYTFYLIDRFGLSIPGAQIHLFAFLAAIVLGTVIGGPVGDRMGRKFVMWFSILGVLPFTLALPYADLFWTEILTVLIGVIMALALPSILVSAQELIPGQIGMISGLFLGVGFGVAGIAAATLGNLADVTSIEFVYRVCSFLPLIGLLTVFLPDTEKPRAR